jgi:hypothetical protein
MIVAFNTSEGWSRDASEKIAEELRQRCALRGEVPAFLEDFLDRYGGQAIVQLPLL